MAIVDAALARGATIAEACAEAGISTRTRYRWLARGFGIKACEPQDGTARALGLDPAEARKRWDSGEVHCAKHGWTADTYRNGRRRPGCGACARERRHAWRRRSDRA